MAVTADFDGGPVGGRLSRRAVRNVPDDLSIICPTAPPLLAGPLAAALLNLIANARDAPVARRHADDLSSKAS